MRPRNTNPRNTNPRNTNPRKTNPRPRKTKPIRSRCWRTGGWPKWTGLVLCVLLTIVWLGSAFCYAKIATPFAPPKRQFVLYARNGWLHAFELDTYPLNIKGLHDLFKGGFSSGFTSDVSLTLNQWHFLRSHDFRVPVSYYYSVTFPLWLPLLLIAFPTGWLWWRDRASRWKNRCPNPRCRYLLTGLTSPKCPECGTEVSPEEVKGKR